AGIGAGIRAPEHLAQSIGETEQRPPIPPQSDLHRRPKTGGAIQRRKKPSSDSHARSSQSTGAAEREPSGDYMSEYLVTSEEQAVIQPGPGAGPHGDHPGHGQSPPASSA